MIRTNSFKSICILAAFIIHSTSLFAQDGATVVTQDFESWYTIGAKYKASKKWEFGIEQGLRLRQNSSITDQVLTELNVGWSPIQLIEIGLGARYINDRDNNNNLDNDFRWNADLALKHKIDRLSFKYRVRYQNKNEIGLTSDEGDESKNYLRFKVGLKYNIKNWKFDPKLSAEIFRDLTKYTGSFDKFRWTIGTGYNFKKFGELDIYFRMERDLGISYPKTTNIVGLQYSFTFKNKK